MVIGYGKVKKKEVTGAVSSVKAEDLENIITSDLGAALQGQVPGLNIVANSGAPGATSEILVRGVTSVTGSNTPLFVVDGVPQEGNPNISPNEIERIDVLRDASSTAIYGSRGASGVILITTKQGKPGALKVNVNASSGFQHITSRAVPLMNAAQQTYFRLITAKNSSTANLPDDKISLGFEINPIGLVYDTDLSEDIILDNKPVHNYNVGISGGSKGFSYNVTGGFYQKEGVIVNSSFNRFNIRANTLYKNNKWDINTSIGLAYEFTENSPGGIVIQTLKYAPGQMPLRKNNVDDVLVTEGGATGITLGNVLESLQNESTNNTNKSLVNLNVGYEVFKNFKLSSRLGLTSTNEYGYFFNPFQQVFDVWGQNLSPVTSSGVDMSAARRKSVSWDALANYTLKFSEHALAFTGGITYENYFLSRFMAAGDGVLNNAVRTLSGTSINPAIGSGPDYSTTLLGSLVRMQYDYKGKYHLSSSVRRDGSSRFSSENRWGIFPSFAAAWNVSDEVFWDPIRKSVSDFKFRASYGTEGNQNFGDYNYAASITPGYDYAFGRFGSEVFTTGGIQSSFSNPQVKWETSIQTNIGADMGLFKNKLTLSADYYDKRNKDMLFPLTLPGSTGGNNVILNVGNMTNKGFELAVTYRTKVRKVNVQMNSVFSTNDNEITKINGLGGFLYTDDFGLVAGAKEHSQITVLAEGYEAGAFFLYATDGIVDTHEKLAAYQRIRPSARMGDLVYRDSNGDGVISDADRIYGGSGLPKYEVGFNASADYKGFDISMNWYSALWHEIMNGSHATAFAYARARDLVYAWSATNPVTPVPRYAGDIRQHDNFKGYTDLWLEDGSYLRLKQITFGYSLPKKVLSKINMTSLRFYISAQNPITFTNYSGFDPEIGGALRSRGLDKGNYPITSFYLMGVNLNF